MNEPLVNRVQEEIRALSPMKPVLMFYDESNNVYKKGFLELAKTRGINLTPVSESPEVIRQMDVGISEHSGLLFTSIRMKGFEEVFQAAQVREFPIVVATGADIGDIPDYVLDGARKVVSTPCDYKILYKALKNAFMLG